MAPESKVTPEAMVGYRATARRRQARVQQELRSRQARAWGLAPADTFRAMGAVMDLDAEIEINLVDVGACRPALLAIID